MKVVVHAKKNTGDLYWTHRVSRTEKEREREHLSPKKGTVCTVYQTDNQRLKKERIERGTCPLHQKKNHQKKIL